MSEALADWCEAIGDNTIICGTDYEERSRTPLGERWCFYHRRRHEFTQVVMAPAGLSYYGPYVEVYGETDGCRDLFPGWFRTWEYPE